jgi:uncharacterized membrane protein YphA (DoxX/SURF4 family)
MSGNPVRDAARVTILLVLLRMVMGVFWFEHSRDKWGWFADNDLHRRLTRYSESATGAQKSFLEEFAIPNYKALQVLVIAGELAVGLAFFFGVLTRPAALGGIFMALTFLYAQGELLDWGIFRNPYGPVVITATLVAGFSGADEHFSVGRYLRRKRAPRMVS